MQVLSFEEKIRLKTLQAESTRTISCIGKISQGKSLILSQHGRCTAERDLSALKDVHPVRKRERAVDMLLDQNNTGPPTANLWKDFKELVNNLGSKSQREFIEQQQFRFGDQGSRNRDHLLLPARQPPGECCFLFFERWKEFVNPRQALFCWSRGA